VLWSLALGASLTVSGAAVLHGCGSGISPVEVADEQDAVDAFSVSQTTGNTAGNFSLRIDSSSISDLSQATVTVGGQNCPVRFDANNSTIRCLAPALTAGSHDVVVTVPSGTFTKTAAITYEATIKFSRDIKPFFEQPLFDDEGITHANNVACIFCHSPMSPTVGDTSATVYTRTECPTSGNCGGRTAFAGLKGTIATIGFPGTGTPSAAQDLTQTSASTKFPFGGSMGNKYLGERDTATYTDKGYALANHFDIAATGYQFDCSALKYGLSHDTSGNTTTTPLSRVYTKLATGGSMPAVTTGAPDTDARSSPVRLVTAQLDLIEDWMDPVIGNGDCTQ
jgi:hypothetical protein